MFTNIQYGASNDPQVVDIAGLTPTNNGVIIGNGTHFVIQTGSTLLGNIGVGTASNVQHAKLGLGVAPSNVLDVAGAAAIGGSYAGSVTPQTNGLSVQGKILSGGGSSPTSTFAFGVGHIQAENDVYAVIGAVTHNNISGNYSVVQMIKSRGTQASPSVLQDKDIIGSLAALGYDGATYNLFGSIDCIVNGTPGSGDCPGAWLIKTCSDGSASLVERARFDSAGNVGIGVTSFGSGAVKVLAIGNGTQGGALSDAVQIASKDLSSGNTMVSIRLEGTAAKKSTGLLALSSFDRAFAVEVNGETIWLIAASVEPT